MKENIFHNIDTKEKAYWLGFILADGYVKSNMFRLCLSVKDEEHLNKFIDFIDGKKSDKKYYGPYKTSGKQVHYCIYSNKFVKNLSKYGCVNKKSKNLRFPKIDKKFNVAFYLGYYDGDGTAGRCEITCGSLNFLKDVVKVFNLPKKIVKKGNNIYVIRFPIGLFHSMIEAIDFSMPRKRNLTKKLTNDERKKVNENRGIKQRRFHVSKEELEKLVWQKPLQEIGKYFNVSGNAIKKRCIKYNISWPKKGYWLRNKK